jgi:hypothetical protein
LLSRTLATMRPFASYGDERSNIGAEVLFSGDFGKKFTEAILSEVDVIYRCATEAIEWLLASWYRAADKSMTDMTGDNQSRGTTWQKKYRGTVLVGIAVSLFCFDVIKGFYRFPPPYELSIGVISFEFAATLGVMSVYYTFIGLFIDSAPFGPLLESHWEKIGVFFLAFLTSFAGFDILLTVLTGGVPLPWDPT